MADPVPVAVVAVVCADPMVARAKVAVKAYADGNLMASGVESERDCLVVMLFVRG